MTITEKILAQTTGNAAVEPGQYLEVSPNCRVVTGTMIRGATEKYKLLKWGRPLHDPNNLMIVDGHHGATASNDIARAREMSWEWAERMGVPKANIFRLGRSGIENMFAVEKRWALPGRCFFQCVNGHMSTAGAVGAFSMTVSAEANAFLVRGKTWVKVPRTVLVEVVGMAPKGVYPRDVSEALLRKIGRAGAVGAVLEWTGEYIESLPMDGRFAICSQSIFSGAWTSIINPDNVTIDFMKGGTTEQFNPLVSDHDAHYWKKITLDISQLEPLVVVPPSRIDIRAVTEVMGTPITKGFIGSDAGGWLDDLRAAGEILRERRIHPDVVLNITPGTVQILKDAVHEGLLATFLDAECVVPTPCEGMECGYNTPLEANDVCIATGQTNTPGRMGDVTANVYLANAATVAASCLEGRIADPRPYLA